MATNKPFWYAARKGWYVWVTQAGKRSRIRLADSKAEAWRIWQAGVQVGLRKAEGVVAFRELSVLWLERVEVMLERGEVSETWAQRVAGTCRRFLEAHSDILARDVTPTVLHQWLKGSGSYEYTEFGTLKQCFKWGRDSGVLTTDPLAKMQLPARVRRTVLVSREAHQLMVQRAGRRFRQMLIVLWRTGARPSELSKLDWSQVADDCSMAVMHAHKTARKVAKPRTLVFGPCAQTLLRIMGHQKSGRVFEQESGRPWTKDAIVHLMRKLRPGKETAYAYRHAFATRALERGVSAAVVAELMGTSIAMIDRHYGHIYANKDHLKQAASQI